MQIHRTHKLKKPPGDGAPLLVAAQRAATSQRCCDLASELSAHVGGIWFRAHSSEVESVGIPASPNGRVIAQLTVGVPCAGVVEQVEMLVAEVKEHATQTRSVGRAACPVGVVASVVVASVVVASVVVADVDAVVTVVESVADVSVVPIVVASVSEALSVPVPGVSSPPHAAVTARRAKHCRAMNRCIIG